jgi:hypothetical protein
MLPTDAKPVTEWKLQDHAWATAVAGIEQALSSVVKYVRIDRVTDILLGEDLIHVKCRYL